MYGLHFADQLSDATRAELEGLVASLRAWISVDHNEDGTHRTTGRWVSTTYGSDRFTGNHDMVWSVSQANQITFAYQVEPTSRTLTVAMILRQTSVSGTPSTILQIAIPDGYRAKRPAAGVIMLEDNGVRTVGQAAVSDVGASIIEIARIDGAAFSASAGQTSVWGQLVFEVQ